MWHVAFYCKPRLFGPLLTHSFSFGFLVANRVYTGTVEKKLGILGMKLGGLTEHFYVFKLTSITSTVEYRETNSCGV